MNSSSPSSFFGHTAGAGVLLPLLLSFLFTVWAQATTAAAAGCLNLDSPNPIASTYPTLVTGNLNGTTLIVPIALSLARSVLPANYTILEHAYRAWLPDFPAGMYPMMANGYHDHDIQFKAFGMSNPDFSRASLEFPFVDVLGNGYSSFRWAPAMIITSNATVAIAGSESYGIAVTPGRFEPACNAYARQANGSDTFSARGASSSSSSSSVFLELMTRPSAGAEDEDEDAAYAASPYSLAFMRNVTNQPAVANSSSVCDNYVRHYNTSLTTAPGRRPVPVTGDVAARMAPLFSSSADAAAGCADGDDEGTRRWTGVQGWRMATAFTEPPLPRTCASLKGFAG